MALRVMLARAHIRKADVPRNQYVVLHDRCEHAADDGSYPVDPRVLPLALDQRRAEVPRGVHRGAGQRAADQDVHRDRESDGE